VRIVKKTTKGEGRALSILGPGEFFGEMELSGRGAQWTEQRTFALAFSLVT